VYGKIFELGPGTGNQLSRFDTEKIEHIYGVESNLYFAPDIWEKVAEFKLENKYTLILCGVGDCETLAAYDIVESSIDCVLSIQVLCSVSDPDKTAKEM